RRGLSRLLNVLEKFEIKATFFIPGRVAESYPNEVRQVYRSGHEIGNHGYEHENFSCLSTEQQREALVKGNNALKDCCGVSPLGFRMPEGDITTETLIVLQEIGFSYSNSMNGSDLPYLIPSNDKLQQMVEIPSHWEL